MASPIRVLRRKRRQPPLTGTAADVVQWFVDDLTSGAGVTTFRLLFLATGMSQTADALGVDFEIYFDGGSGFGQRTINSATCGPTVDGFEVVIECADEISGVGLPYQVLLRQDQTSLRGPSGQTLFSGQVFPAGRHGSVCASA